MNKNNKTLFEKIWDAHVVYEQQDQPSVLYIDLHMIHEVTSPQAFEGLRLAKRKVRRPDLTIAVAEHNVPTWAGRKITDPIAKTQIETLSKNCEEFGIQLFDMYHKNQGIVHVIGPDLGLTQPGKIIVCGDSHTSTNGAFGAFAMGIGTSEVEHVLATQTLRQFKPKTMNIHLEGDLPNGVTAKDVILGIIKNIGISGATGHAIEYTGKAITNLSMEGRMTVCNMSIEAGGRAGMIAPDLKTIKYLEGKTFAPKGKDFEKARNSWLNLKTDEGAIYDKQVIINSESFEPFVTWGTNPGMVAPITGKIPNPKDSKDIDEKISIEKALEYMGLKPDTQIQDIKIDRVFIGSCTNSRIEDLEAAAQIVKNKKVNSNVNAMVVPGSTLIKSIAEQKGLDKIFKDAGFEWREAGCSMCLGMNPDILQPKERCASTSNRNFEGRQGKGGRTHLVSPEMAAAAAIAGHFVDTRDI